MANAYSSFTLQTSQREPSPFKNEVKNNAGGYVNKISPLKQVERFLILGSSGGTFYVDQVKLTKENAKAVIQAITDNGLEVVKLIKEISVSGRAPKNDPALFALALAASAPDLKVRQAALAALPEVARIPTHLFHFFTYVKNFRGFGRGLKNAIANWYQNKEVNSLAYAVTKYQQRDGVSNRDLLRLSHPKTWDKNRNALYKWIVNGYQPKDETFLANIPKIVPAMEFAKGDASSKELIELIEKFNLSREHLPTEWLATPEVWLAMLPKMGLEQMMRNLGNMTRIGVLAPLSEGTKLVCEKLIDEPALKKARLHPYAILVALKTYESGGGYLSDKTWKPVQSVVDALNKAFYLSFNFLAPTGKNFLLAVDVSGSMNGSMIGGRMDSRGRLIPGLISCSEGAAAIALAIAKTEKNYHIMGFTGGNGGSRFHHGWKTCYEGFVDLGISPQMDMNTALAKTRGLSFGPTDCALPIIWARNNKVKVDAFIVLTDNETWEGQVKVVDALKAYRRDFNRDAKMIVVSMTPTNFSIADPSDPNSLDVSGFDASVPEIINNFVKE